MATVRCPSNVGSITLVTSGVLAPASGLITCTAAEATDLVSPYSKGPNPDGVVKTNLANGNTDFQLPLSITSITINGNVYPVTAGVISAVPPADATIFGQLATYRTGLFLLVQG